MNSLTIGRAALRAALMGSSALIAAALPAAAQDATWLLNPGSGDFNTPANWTPATVPTGTASFGTSNTTALSFSTQTTVGGWTFNAGASNYSFTNGQILTFNAAGIVINGGSASIANETGIQFLNASTAGGATISNDNQIAFSNTSTAGSAIITNNIRAKIDFFDTSTAGNATITNTFNDGGVINFQLASTAGSAAINNNNLGTVNFLQTSTAGNAVITNTGFDANISFFTTSTAGNATINNSGIDANINFNLFSTAGSATITNNDLGAVNFLDNSTASSAHITNNGGEAIINFRGASTAGSAVIANNVNNGVGAIDFFDISTAGSATITNNGVMNFNNTSTAGSATIANNGNDASIDFFDASTAGSATIANAGFAITFHGTSTAGSASFTNNSIIDFRDASTGGSATIANNNLGTIDFRNTSTAGSAGITNSGGIINFFDTSTASSATIANNSLGTIDFHNTSTAGSAGITNSGGIISFLDTSTANSATIANNSLGTIDFHNTSTAGSAGITNSGGIISFLDTSTAGSATIANNSLGTIDFHNASTAGSAGITSNSGGIINFLDTSTASSATVTTNNGGSVFFLNSSTGGTARFITNAGGVFDMSQLASGGMTAGSIEGAGSYFLGANMLTVGGNGLSTTVSGVISDGGAAGGAGGGLTTIGTGTLTLSGINTYTGATNVNGGALVVNGSTATSSLTTVNSGGTLTGTGTVGNTSVAAGGIFMPGSGMPGSSMRVTGNLNFAPSSSYTVALNPTTSSFANVSGTATLGGATVNANFASGSYVFKQYTILNAGTVSGTFAPTIVNSNLPSVFADTLSYDATHVFLNLVLTPVAGPLNINQQNVDNGLLNSFNVNGGIPVAFAGLTPAGLTQLSGEVGASFPQVAFQAGNSFLNLMLNPFTHGQFNGSGGSGAIGYADEKAKGATSAATSAFASVDRKQAPSLDSRYSFWGGAYGGSGSVDGNATTGSHDTSSQVYGFAAGLDYRATPDTTMGFALGGGGTHWSLDQGLGSGRSDMFQAGVYGKTLWGPAYLAGALAYSFHDVTTNRAVAVAGTDMLQAGFDANVFSGRLEGGYRYAMPWAGVTPYGAVQVQSVALPSYTESATSGSNQFALSYASRTETTTRTELGARFDKTWIVGQDTLLTLYSRLAWAHDVGNTAIASAIFQALPASNFIVYGAQPAPNGALITAGAEYKLDNGWSVLAKFDGEFSNTTALYSGSGTIRKVW